MKTSIWQYQFLIAAGICLVIAGWLVGRVLVDVRQAQGYEQTGQVVSAEVVDTRLNWFFVSVENNRWVRPHKYTVSFSLAERQCVVETKRWDWVPLLMAYPTPEVGSSMLVLATSECQFILLDDGVWQRFVWWSAIRSGLFVFFSVLLMIQHVKYRRQAYW